jgi:hypothetical protein
LTRSKLLLLLLGLGLLAVAACTRIERPSTPSASAPPQVEEFFEHLRADVDHTWLEDESVAWLAGQSTEIRVLVAERAIRHADPVVRLIAPMQYYVMGMDGRGDEAIVELALRGDEVGAFSWSWLHDRDATMFKRRLTAIRMVVLSRYPELTPEQRTRAESLLCEEGQSCDLRAEAEALKR